MYLLQLNKVDEEGLGMPISLFRYDLPRMPSNFDPVSLASNSQHWKHFPRESGKPTYLYGGCVCDKHHQYF